MAEQNNFSRRFFLKTLGATCALAVSAPDLSEQIFAYQPAANVDAWTDEWNRAIIANSLKKSDAEFDEKEFLLTAKLNSEYKYHTNLRDQTAHHTRESLDYAGILLEDTSEQRDARRERALKIIERVLSLQETDPKSSFRGLWSYYLEEPVAKMSPPDQNWADFNGEHLLLIYHRHQNRLPEELKIKIVESLALAANFIRNRKISAHYTNIAVKGAHVTLGAAELLNDKVLKTYAVNRLIGWAQAVDQTGSFYEYNSPTYARVTLSILTRMRLMHKDAQVLELTQKLHRRLWLHLANHWHTGTYQWAAPMSRSYGNDVGTSLWLQKALDNKLALATLEEVKTGRKTAIGEIGVLDYDCPADLQERFVAVQKGAQQHREMFLSGDLLIENNQEYKRPKTIRPLQGTSFLAPTYSLGSINYSNFWNQRRPLMAYWGTQKRPANWMQLRLMKDDYDFASALFYSAQNENSVLGAVSFRTDGGVKQPDLDPVKNGEFTAKRIWLQFLFSGWKPEYKILADGKTVENDSFASKSVNFKPLSRVSLALENCKMCLTTRFSIFADKKPLFRIVPIKNQVALELFFLLEPETQTIKWADLKQASAVFTLEMEEGAKNLADFDQKCARQKFALNQEQYRTASTWNSSAGILNLAAGKTLQDLATQDSLFDERVNGKTVPNVRLSDELIAQKS